MIETLRQFLPEFLMPYLDWVITEGQALLGDFWFDSAVTLIWSLARIMVVVGALMGVAAYLSLAERWVIGAMQLRLGPNRVGPFGLIQPLADGLKVLLKEFIMPKGADKVLFFIAPMIAFAPALLAWVVVPFSEIEIAGENTIVALANINASLLFVMSITSIGVYGIILGGWASNSKYALLGSMRASAQMISYEVAMGLSLVTVMMVSGSLNIGEIVQAQNQGIFAGVGAKFLSWNWLPLLPMFVIYIVSIIAETNRAPFDMAEGESEIVGYHVEYSGMAFAIFTLTEYIAMILCAAMASLLFLGGWLSPVDFLPDSIVWLFAKMGAILFFYLWIRATFPRYRYDQIMRLGWKVFIPICLAWMLFIGVWMMSPLNVWK